MTIQRTVVTTGIVVSTVLFLLAIVFPWNAPIVFAIASVAVGLTAGTHSASTKKAQALQAQHDTILLERAILEDKAWLAGAHMISAGIDAYHDFLEVLCRPDIRAENIDQALELAYCFGEENIRKAIQWILPLEETESCKQKQEAQQKLAKAKEIQNKELTAETRIRKEFDADRDFLEQQFKGVVREFYPDWSDSRIHIAWVNARRDHTLTEIANELGIEL